MITASLPFRVPRPILGLIGHAPPIVWEMGEIVLDLSMPDKNHVPPAEVRALLNHTKIIAIAFGIDGLAAELAESLGAAKLLDEMELARELVPTILALAPS